MAEQQWQWFKKGDIIRLEKGMVVDAWVPKKYVRSSYHFDNKATLHQITIGEVFHNVPISKEKLIQKIYYRLHDGFDALRGAEISLENISDFVDSLSLDFTPSKFDTSTLVGEYIVISNNAHVVSDSDPREYFVCQKLDDPTIRVSLSQHKEFMENFPNCRPINHEA